MRDSEQGARLRVSCRGVVQGLGARPALQRLAASLRLRGSLSNAFGALQIDLAGPRGALEDFLAAMPSALPGGTLWRLESPRWQDAPDPPWPEGVRLEIAGEVPLGRAPIAPGLSAERAPCANCLAELADGESRRYRYPFISCCDCGPRYTLATALPFCRAHTTLASFPPCAACAREFRNTADRRFHAETISCPLCGPRLSLLDRGGQPLHGNDGALQAAAHLLLAGQILALQGVGGFQLLVDATSPTAVRRLRERKHRPSKPFALLIAHLRQLEASVEVSAGEEGALRHPAAPIVLLRRRFGGGGDPWDPVAPGCPALGVMLPASGLHHLLMELVDRPVVATSGNRSGEPLCLSPQEAVEGLGGIADAFLIHDLPIARPLDDSVLQLVDGRPALLRRARGFVPEPLPWQGPKRPPSPPATPEAAVLAMGGDLKTAPALVMGDRIWLAPHGGDLADGAVQRRWQGALEDQLQGDWAPVKALACDAHPGYVSHQLLGRIAHQHGLSLFTVPHHLAHGLAVGAEHGLQPPFLVVACDGLGLADPNRPAGEERLWGGELLWVEGWREGDLAWQRLAALRPFPLPGGDRASREPRRCGLGLLAAAGAWALAHPGARDCVEAFPPPERQLLHQALLQGCHTPTTSSLGRLLDGCVSLLGLAQILSYEGEGGVRWQRAAAGGRANPMALSPPAEPWILPLRPSRPGEPGPLPLGRWDWEPLLGSLLADRAAGGDPALAAWQLERAIIAGIVEGDCAAATFTGCRVVALAGGCFQNRSLLEGCLQGLRQRCLTPHWGERVPCNDGGLALGQAWAVQASQMAL
ncbi:MAG: carbamoyltransferase HypF [Cyanobium sp.]